MALAAAVVAYKALDMAVNKAAESVHRFDTVLKDVSPKYLQASYALSDNFNALTATIAMAVEPVLLKLVDGLSVVFMRLQDVVVDTANWFSKLSGSDWKAEKFTAQDWRTLLDIKAVTQPPQKVGVESLQSAMMQRMFQTNTMQRQLDVLERQLLQSIRTNQLLEKGTGMQ
jgi:hypothetical protein